jgi:two-component system phosphate regulon sensor histidine kinase PhoR
MKKKQIYALIGLMSFAMLGLVVLQYQWIRKAIELKEHHFEMSVTESLKRAADRIEQADAAQTAAKFILNKIAPTTTDSSLVQVLMESAHFRETQFSHQTAAICRRPNPKSTKGTTNNAAGVSYRLTQIEASNTETDENSPYLGVEFGTADSVILVNQVMPNSPAAEAGLQPNDIITAINDQEVWDAKTLIQMLKEYEVGEDISIAYRRPASNEHLQHIAQATLQDPGIQRNISMYQNLAIKNLFERQVNKERLEIPTIDSILNTTLTDAGINEPYQYAIVKGKKILYNSTGKMKKIPESSFKKNIFTSDIANTSAELWVYFPNQKSYIWQSSGIMLSSSLFLNLIIIGIFAYTVNTIIQQKKLSDIKTDFINNMTHELKTPISTIGLAAEMLTDRSLQRTEKSILRYANMIRDENQRLQNHVEKVLQFARLESGNIKLNIQEIDVHDLLENILPKVSLQIEQLHGELIYEPNAQKSNIQGDAEHITNVIYNLLDNAIKYSPHTSKIIVSTQSSNDSLKISIQDHGIGMNKDTINKIFEQFYRVPTGNIHNVKGFGLGLSYVKLMAEAHHGSIQVLSKLDKGSTFSLTLPFVQPTKVN